MQQRVFSFLSDDNQHPDLTNTEDENEKCSEDGGLNTADTVNSVFHCNTIHHAMTFHFLILMGNSKGLIGIMDFGA